MGILIGLDLWVSESLMAVRSVTHQYALHSHQEPNPGSAEVNGIFATDFSGIRVWIWPSLFGPHIQNNPLMHVWKARVSLARVSEKEWAKELDR